MNPILPTPGRRPTGLPTDTATTPDDGGSPTTPPDDGGTTPPDEGGSGEPTGGGLPSGDNLG